MKNILSNIRNLINRPWQQGILLNDNNKWDMLCAALDTIEDTEIAVKEYMNKKGIGLYLPIYGLLQALFLQEDAIDALNYSLFNERINFKEDYPKIYKIRELRSQTIGHPTNFKRNNRNSFCTINRSSINEKGFKYAIYIPNESTIFRDINLHEIIKNHNIIVKKILEQTTNKLEKEFSNHKKQFKDKKLIDLIPSSFDYHISKLCKFNNNLDVVNFNLEIINKIYNEIINSLILRYGDEKSLPSGVDCVKKEIDFILSKLSVFYENINKFDEREIYIYIDQLKVKFEEMKEMLLEIDKEFSNSK